MEKTKTVIFDCSGIAKTLIRTFLFFFFKELPIYKKVRYFCLGIILFAAMQRVTRTMSEQVTMSE